METYDRNPKYPMNRDEAFDLIKRNKRTAVATKWGNGEACFFYGADGHTLCMKLPDLDPCIMEPLVRMHFLTSYMFRELDSIPF